MTHHHTLLLQSPVTVWTETGACPPVVEALNVGVVCCRLDERLTFVWGNTRFFDGVGYTREEYGRLFPDLRAYCATSPEEFASLRRAVSAVREKGDRSFELPVRLPRKDGTFLRARLAGSLTADAEDGPLLQAVLLDADDEKDDLTDKVRLCDQKMQYFHWMLDVYAGNVYVSDMATYELLYLNQTSYDTLGASPRDVLGRKCYEVIQGRTAPCPFCTNDRLREDEFYEWEFFNPILKRTFLIRNRIIDWEGHRARIELSYDMYSTEYKLAKKDKERATLVRSIPGGFIRLDARDLDTILWYGADFLSIVGYTEEQFEQELHSRFAYLYPDDYARLVPLLRAMNTSGQSMVTEARIITRNGRTKYLTMTLCYASGEECWDGIPSIYSVGIDITQDREEQARQRKALEEAYETARVASAAKTNFLSTMSHDIRTPMNAIMGMGIIAQANLNAPDKVRDCLDKINASSRHLLSLLNEILDMSKIESGKIDLITEGVEFPKLLQDVMDICQPLLAEKHQEFEVSAAGMWHEKVVTDGSRLQQIFINLLSNAIKYTPEGGKISLNIQEMPSAIANQGQYEFIFTDNGIGMTEVFLPHIFEPFTRAEDSRVSQTQGTGLGMAITENIVRMMNGTIEVKSEWGVGSQFIVSLPLILDEEEEANAPELVGLPVLIADNDQVVCESATALLKELGVSACWVLSGPEAIRSVMEAHESGQDFFAVILDWKMPGMSGLETIKIIRAKLGQDIPIIIISAYDYSDIEEEFKRAGADAFLTKPLFKSKMLHILQSLCRSRSSEPVALPPQEHPADLEGKRILLVEDNALNREIAVELLHMHGLRVDTAENGQCAVEIFQGSAPGDYDCILMDIQMPVMDGYEATALIRALNRADAQTIPILALTADVFAANLGRAHSSGMNDHITKPIHIERLLDALRHWMR